jgi:NAD(P)-dependent dehydrogenase (short-subunit alcohol dehydrogenase family)
MDFKNKIVVVTGGGQGIGRAICLKFAFANGRVIIIDRNEETAKTVKDEIKEKGFDAAAYKGDKKHF